MEVDNDLCVSYPSELNIMLFSMGVLVAVLFHTQAVHRTLY